MSIWAPPESPPAAPVLLLTLELSIEDLSRTLGLVLVTLLSCVSVGVAATVTFVLGSFPSLWRTLTLAGGRPLEEEVEEDVGISEGGSLNLPPRRRRVIRVAFVAGSSFLDGGGFLRTPAYWRTEPSPSLSSSSSSSMFVAAFSGFRASSRSSPLSRRLNTPVGCKIKITLWDRGVGFTKDREPLRHEVLTLLLLVVVSAFASAPSLSNTEVRFKPF